MESTCQILQNSEEPLSESFEKVDSKDIVDSFCLIPKDERELPQHEVNTTVQSIYNFEPCVQNIYSLDTIKEEFYTFENICYNVTNPSKRSLKSKKSKLGNHKCEICSSTFKSEYTYRRHLANHTQDRIECNFCNKFFRKNRFLSHVLVHTGEKPHICKICNRGFRQSRDLKQHSFTHTGEKPYSCHICGKQFSDTSSRRKHLQLHTGEKPYSCEICDKSFTQLSHLREHQVTHTKEKRHDCTLCGKKFTTKSSVQRHLLTHTNTCDICSETFTSSLTLNRHKEMHSIDRPFSCKHCTKRFFKKTDLTTHMILHTEEKTISCNICGALFKCHRHFRLHHQQNHLSTERPHICQICKKGFFIETSLKKHSFVHNPEKRVRQRKTLCHLDSEEKHPCLSSETFYNCSFCEKKYRHKQDLYRHVRICHKETISQEIDLQSIVKIEC